MRNETLIVLLLTELFMLLHLFLSLSKRLCRLIRQSGGCA